MRVEYMREKILEELCRIERDHNVKILFAVESGSRAWGFPSTDSDYDVRFVFCHSVEWYLSIDEKRDVIECPISDALDISGWDIRKALQLFRKSNPSILEWIHSPISYRQQLDFPERLQQIAYDSFNKKAVLYHYLHMASKNYRLFLQKEKVKLKKYFYVLRPLFACKWIEEKGTLPPVEFETLMNEVKLPAEIVSEIQVLLQQKKAGAELDDEKQVKILNLFLERQIDYYEQYAKKLEKGQEVHVEELNELFREIVCGSECSH
ncbi:nucleotidyltransferase domain-containing protein [Bacillus manliponensis]